MKITSLQVTDSGAVLLNGVEYAPKDDTSTIDPEYVASLEQHIAHLENHIKDIQDGYEGHEANISTELEAVRRLLTEYTGSMPTSVVGPDSGFGINDLLNDLRNDEEPVPEKIIVRSGSYHEMLNLSGIKDLTLVLEDVEISGLRKAEWELDGYTGDNSFVPAHFPGYRGPLALER